MKKAFADRIPLIIFMTVYLAVVFITYRDYGMSMDEPKVYNRGKLLYQKVRGNDPVLQRDAVIAGAANGFAYYNNFYAVVLYAINGSENIEVYHLLNMLFGGLVFIAVYELLLHETNNRYISVAGPIILFFTPRFFGHLAINPKDMPFAVYYTISLTLIYLFTGKRSSELWIERLRLLLLGIAFGLTASQRIVGYTIYFIYLLYQFLDQVWQKRRLEKRAILDILSGFAIIFIIGYFVHMTTLPLLGADPINNFFALLTRAKSFPWGGSVLIFGKEFSENNIPRYYMPLWLGITTPLFIILLFFGSFIFIRLKNRLLLFLLISLAINLAFFIGLKPVVYDGVRHGLYLLPQIAVVAILSLFYLLKSKFNYAKKIMLLMMAVNILWVSYNYISLHPFQFLYFNVLTGGFKEHRFRFETDFWGLAEKETVYWLKSNIKPENLKGKTIGVNGNVDAVAVYAKKLNLPVTVTGYEKGGNYDYVSCWDRWNGCSAVKGKLIGTVSRRGLILNSIYKTR